MDAITQIAQLLIIGLSVGSIISIGSVGLSVSYGVMKFPNIAHGYLLTFGTFVTFFLWSQLGWGTAPIGNFSFGWSFFGIMLAAGVVSGVIAVILDFTVFRILQRRGSLPIISLVASIGAAIVLRGVIYAIWGTDRYNYSGAIIPDITLPFLEISIHADRVFIFGLVIVVAILLYFYLYKTRFGKAMRATSENSDLAEVTGINTDRVRAITWFISGFLAGIAGALFGLQEIVFFNTGFTFLLPIIAATILGGIGNPWGALLAGLLIGVAQEVSIYWIPSSIKPAVPFAIMILVLLVRPQGLLGRKAN